MATDTSSVYLLDTDTKCTPVGYEHGVKGSGRDHDIEGEWERDVVRQTVAPFDLSGEKWSREECSGGAMWANQLQDSIKIPQIVTRVCSDVLISWRTVVLPSWHRGKLLLALTIKKIAMPLESLKGSSFQRLDKRHTNCGDRQTDRQTQETDRGRQWEGGSKWQLQNRAEQVKVLDEAEAESETRLAFD